MRLTFLAAAIPLTKTISYSPRTGAYTTASYPMVSKVTSYEVEVDSTLSFARAIEEQGRLGRCLLKGGLDQPLVDQSRAGHSVDEDHEWVCFDFDKVDCPPTFEGALVAIGKYLPKYTHDVEAVIQLSASCFHPEARHLSAHVFMRLSEPVSTKVLTDWLTWINFQPDVLPEVRLTDSGNALSFPVDRSVASPAKLLYIAPPRTVGWTPGQTDNVRTVSGKHKSLTIPMFDPISKMEEYAHVNKLRADMGMDARTFTFSKHRGIDVINGSEESRIHDVRNSGDGYIRFNLNGGDSLAYFINLREPELVGNFKGEPYMYTKQVDEAFYKALVKASKSAPKVRQQEGTEVLAFYATNQGSKLYIGTYNRITDTLRVDPSAETPAYSWMREHGVVVKESFPHYDLCYDIRSNIRFEQGYPVINLYERTQFIKEYADLPRNQALDPPALFDRLSKECPVIFKTLKSVTGDERSLLLFLNWLGHIFQTREKATSAWVLWGVQGTGKGQMMQHIIRPLFGSSHVGQVLMKAVDSQFNSQLEGKMFMNIDEAALTQTRDKIETMSKLKNWITEPTIEINTKFVVEHSVESFVNFIITSNDSRPVVVDKDDRRFHVGSRQTERLQYSPSEMATLVQGEELPNLAKTLGELQVDEFLVRNPEWNAAKQQLFQSTHSLPDRVALALFEGDTNFFYEARPSDTQLAVNRVLLPMAEYDAILRAMADNTFSVMKREDLYVLFKVVVNDDKFFPENVTQQRTLFQRLGLTPKDSDTHHDKRTGKSAYGIKAPVWQPVREDLLEVLPVKHAGNVTNIKEAKA